MVPKLPLLLAATALLATAARAGTVHVPADFPTIQEGVINTQDGDTLVIGPGTYNESITIDHANGLRIKASPKAIVHPPAADVGLTVTGCTDLQVRGLHIANGAAQGILVQDSVVVSLIKCDVENMAGHAIEATGTLDLTVDGCRLVGFGEAGIDAAGFGGDLDDDDILITHCFIDGTGGANYGIIQKGNNTRIENNQVVMGSGATAISLGFDDRVLAHVVHNRLTGDLRIARSVAFSDRNRIQNGVFVLQGPGLRSTRDTLIDGMMLLQSNGNIHVSDAKVMGPACLGVVIQVSNVELARVTVSDSTLRGIDLQSSFFVALEACKLKNCAEGIIVDANSNAVVAGCSVTGCAGTGLDVLGDNCLIGKNHVTGSATLGLHLGAASSGNHLTANVVKGSGSFDLQDDSGGANTVDTDNVFGTVAP